MLQHGRKQRTSSFQGHLQRCVGMHGVAFERAVKDVTAAGCLVHTHLACKPGDLQGVMINSASFAAKLMTMVGRWWCCACCACCAFTACLCCA